MSADTTITADNAANHPGHPVRVETADGATVFGEIEVFEVLGHPSRARVRCLQPIGGGTLPGDKYWNSDSSVVQRVTLASREELIAFVSAGRAVAAKWCVGENEWVEPRDGFLPTVLQGQTEWTNGSRKAADQGFQGVTFHHFNITAIEPHARFETYKLLDGAAIEYPVEGWQYRLPAGQWMDGRGKAV